MAAHPAILVHIYVHGAPSIEFLVLKFRAGPLFPLWVFMALHAFQKNLCDSFRISVTSLSDQMVEDYLMVCRSSSKKAFPRGQCHPVHDLQAT